MPKTLNGVDEASYQAGIDNGKVASDFVIVKATEGTGYTNPAMTSQLNSAKKAGKKIGLYHFADGANYQAEADYFLRTAKPYLKNAVLVLDYEGAVVPMCGVSWAKKWLDYVYKKTGTKPLIYMGLADENAYDWSSISSKYYLWVAQYNTMSPQYGYKPRKLYGTLRNWSESKLAIFQYTSTGRLSGWNGDLDLNVYYGKGTDWNKHSKNDTKGDKEMTWKVKVPITAMGGFLVTKQKGATIWSGPNNEKKTDTLKYNKVRTVTDFKNGCFYKVKEGWIDGRCGIYKPNPLYSNSHIHCIIEVTGSAKGHADAGGPVTGRKFKKGDRYKAYQLKDGYLKIGAGKDKWINGEKVKIIL
ncbi:GH25 family lysozyme [Lactobacillus sp. ESL0681]|uniref:GH25 family lysozyme n=1 Tax=Lactobacillus sp. ESL0681 TaxID=2983211 RepID=UPI0023FA4904|nr:GH25 family lysozyme [Lactobacillus sp. ESL0681]WEV40375.1 GH25 family lysozyme [Lactobacillus sp. ESL0681]